MKKMRKRVIILWTVLLILLSLFSVSLETQAKSKKNQNKKTAQQEITHYYFRNQKLLNQHYEKHGIEMGFDNAEDYEEAACQVANDPNALHKTEKEDGDDIYYLEDTNDFVIISTDGYIRTYFWPSAGIKYYNKQ